jgi:hypothetical protein
VSWWTVNGVETGEVPVQASAYEQLQKPCERGIDLHLGLDLHSLLRES